MIAEDAQVNSIVSLVYRASDGGDRIAFGLKPGLHMGKAIS